MNKIIRKQTKKKATIERAMLGVTLKERKESEEIIEDKAKT